MVHTSPLGAAAPPCNDGPMRRPAVGIPIPAPAAAGDDASRALGGDPAPPAADCEQDSQFTHTQYFNRSQSVEQIFPASLAVEAVQCLSLTETRRVNKQLFVGPPRSG